MSMTAPNLVAAEPAVSHAIRPFHIEIHQDTIDDPRRRIAATRWPDRETVTDRSQGVQLAKLKPLVEYWGTGCDWRKVEATLNALPVTELDGSHVIMISQPQAVTEVILQAVAALGAREPLGTAG